MAVVLNGMTNDITVNGVSVATDTEVSSAVVSAVAPKANTADLKEIGVGQTWQDVTSSRVLGTTYTNSTGKPISILITVLANNYNTYVGCDCYCDNVLLAFSASNEGITRSTGICTAIIPAASTYRVETYSGAISRWVELR